MKERESLIFQFWLSLIIAICDATIGGLLLYSHSNGIAVVGGFFLITLALVALVTASKARFLKTVYSRSK